jgi:hypothetical protein
MIPSDVKTLLEVLTAAHEGVVDRDFAARMREKARSPVLTIGFFSPASSLAYHYPFLFPRGFRIAMLKIVAFSPAISFPLLLKMSSGIELKVPPPVRVKCHIDRDRIVPDGMLMLSVFGPGITHICVNFTGEAESGIGPTREFFREFAKSVFRDFSGYPSPNSSHLLVQPKLLGLLVGKAIMMDIPLPVHMSPAFLDFAFRGKVPSLAEARPDLAQSLENPEVFYGQSFVCEGFPLKPGREGEIVTADNFSNYCRLVETHFTCGLGAEITRAAVDFANGFGMVIKREFTKFLSAVELCALIAGETAVITAEDLETLFDVELDDQTSGQWRDLKEIILGLDAAHQGRLIEFITGNDRLPLGGLKKVKPRIGVCWPGEFRDEPGRLPSVVTCDHMMFLPCYPGKEIMRAKLLYALEACPYGFI